MSLSDFLAILDIVVTVLFGFVITHIVFVRDSRTRAIKDYYIQELSSIKTEINVFYSKLFKNDYEAKDIIGWYSAIRNRVNSFDTAVRNTFRLYDASIAGRLFLNYKHITNTDEFNANYAKGKILFSGKAKRDIGQDERKLYLLIDQTLYDINNARSGDYLGRKFQEFKSHYFYYRTAEKKSRIYSCFAIGCDWLNSHKSSIILVTFCLCCFYFLFLNLRRFVKIEKDNELQTDLIVRLDSINANIRDIAKNGMVVPPELDSLSGYFAHQKNAISSDSADLIKEKAPVRIVGGDF